MKKTFIGLVIAMLICVGVYYGYQYLNEDQLVDSGYPVKEKLPLIDEESAPVSKVDEQKPSEPVTRVEKFIEPFQVDAVIVKDYFDLNDPLEKQSESVVFFENVYRPNLGIDYGYNNDAFNVIASFSGKVTEVYDDAIMGKSVVIANDVYQMIYQSLGETTVKINDQVKQGQVIGKSGESIYNSEIGNHLHIILMKNGKTLDFTQYINQTTR